MKSRSRVAYFLSVYPNPTETFVHKEIAYLVDHGVDVHVFAIKRPTSTDVPTVSVPVTYSRPSHLLLGLVSSLYLLLTRPKRYFTCIAIILRQAPNYPYPVVLKLFYHLFAAAIYIPKIRKSKIPHIHAHFSTAGSSALFVHTLLGTSFSFTAHASGDIYYQPILLKEKMEKCSSIIACSEYNRTYLNLISDYANPDKIAVVYHSVTVASKEPIGPINSPVKLVSVGSFTYFKGYPTLIAACSLLKNRGLLFRLSIVGEGPQRRIIEKLIADSALTDQIVLRGALPHQDAMEVIKSSDIFVLASEIYLNGIRDGMPKVCTEAMSLGVPVVSTYVSGIPELIENEVTGLLVPEKTPVQLANAIARIIEDPELREKLRDNAHEWVKNCYNIEKTMGEFMSVLEQHCGI